MNRFFTCPYEHSSTSPGRLWPTAVNHSQKNVFSRCFVFNEMQCEVRSGRMAAHANVRESLTSAKGADGIHESKLSTNPVGVNAGRVCFRPDIGRFADSKQEHRFFGTTIDEAGAGRHGSPGH